MTAIATILLVLAIPAGADATRVSISPNPHTMLPEHHPDNVQLLQALDPHSVKVEIPWLAVEPRRGQFDWSYVDTRLAWLAEAGLKADVLISHAPRWATNGRCTAEGACYPRRSHYDDWRRVTSKAVDRYGPDGSFWDRRGLPPRFDITTWESWHEPNVPHYWEDRPNVAQYYRVHEQFARAVRDAHPRARVMLGSFTYSDPATVAYVKRLFRSFPVEGTFDSVAVHPYAATAQGALRRIRDFRRVTGAKRIWVDEIGWNTAARDPNQFTVTPAEQARNLRILIDGVRRSMPYVKQISVFSLFDLNSGGGSRDSGSTYGLFRDPSKGYTPKPAFDVVEARTER